MIASASRTDGPHIWDARTGQCITVLSERLGYEAALAFSPHSDLLAFGSTYNHHLQLWDIRAGSYRITLEGSIGVLVITFSPESPFIAAGSYDQNVRLWNTETGDLLLTIPYLSLKPRVEFLTGMNVVFIDAIGHEIAHPSESPALVIADRSCLISDLQLGRSMEWVTRSSKRVLWLPPDRCPKHRDAYAVWRNKIAIGSGDGLMTFLTLDDEPNLSGGEELSIAEGGLG